MLCDPAITVGLPYSFYKCFIGSSKPGLDHLIFEGRSERFEKNFLQSLYSQKDHATQMAKKMHTQP